MQQPNTLSKRTQNSALKNLFIYALALVLLSALTPLLSHATEYSEVYSLRVHSTLPDAPELDFSHQEEYPSEIIQETDDSLIPEDPSTSLGSPRENIDVIATATNSTGTRNIYNSEEFVDVAKAAEEAGSDTTITLYADIELSRNIRFYDNISEPITLTFTSEPGQVYTISPADNYSIKASGYTTPDDRAMFSTQGGGLNLVFDTIDFDGKNYTYVPDGLSESQTRGVRLVDWENGSLTINNSTVENFTLSPFYSVEAVINIERDSYYPAEDTTLTIDGATIKNNSFAKIGADSLLIKAYETGAVDITNSTIYDNTLNGYYYTSLLTLAGEITLENTSIYNNIIAKNSEYNGSSSQLLGTEGNSHLTLGDGAHIYSNTITGTNNLANNYSLDAAVVKSYWYTTAVMKDGAKIYDNEILGGAFSAVALCTYGSTFIMNGGEIKDNTIDKKEGTAIFFSSVDGVVMSQSLSSKALNTITINGGEISGNKFDSYLGVVAGMSADVLITGGTISDNVNDRGRNGATLHGLYSSASQKLEDAKGSLIVSGGTIDAGEGVVLGVGNKNIDDETSGAYPRLLKITGSPDLTGAIELRGPTHVLTLDKSGAEGLSQVYPVLKHGIPHEAPSNETEEYVIVVGEGGLDVSNTANHFSDYFDYLTSLPGTGTNLSTVVLKFHEVITYTISYELNGGTNNPANPVSYTLESEEITLAAPSRTGYQFEGWYTTADFSDAPVTAIPSGSEGNITLYAKWSETPLPSPTPTPSPTPSPDPSHDNDINKNSSASHMLPNTGDRTITSLALLVFCGAIAFIIARATRTRS